ncbi:DNA methyltransferase [Glutamicibacter uratoxydans]|uniref:DNA methyltransferase n=1 Tax=Glutamicibacter uratoxydans TaxID=43667 RepID=UPI003D6FACE1
MPSFDSMIVGEDWISEHYFTTDSTKESFHGEVLKLRKAWDEDAKAGHPTALTRFTQARGELQVRLAELMEAPAGAAHAYALLRTALGFNGPTAQYVSRRSGTETALDQVWASPTGEVLFIEADPADSLEDFLGQSRPLGLVSVDGKPDARPVAKHVSEIYLGDQAPNFVVVMAGKWLILTEPERWAEGRYLAVDVLLVADRNDTKRGQEVDRFLAIFGRESLLPSPEGDIWWTGILESSVKHTVGVSQDLREGIRRSIEIIANDVLTRRTAQGLPLDEVDGQELAKQSLRFLYRILFLLYAEASPELGVLPVGVGEYNEGYGLDRLRELTLVEIHEDRSRRGTHIYQSLNGLFKLVDKGHTPKAHGKKSAENEGLRFDALKADLFAETATSFINEVKLSNSALQRVLQHLLLSKESKGKDRGFISYAELGINQLGAVYEGLMSYTGFIAETDLHEVAKNGDATKGSWVVPTDRSASIDSKHFIKIRNERTGEPETVVHPRGSFVFRLAGRERQQSASYYTPEVLTKFVVSQALEELLDQDGEMTAADDILALTVCEPALGSGAFAIEAVRQLAAEYLKRKQVELDRKIPADQYPQELQKVKAHIALHQVHGVDLNSTAVELAEVSLWLDTMTSDLQAPWFGMRLKQGNSLVGARRATYSVQAVKAKAYLSEEPQANPLTGLVAALDAETTDPAVDGRIHHFLLPGEGWGAAADAKEVKDIAGPEQKELKAWAKSTRLALKKTQIDRLVALSERVEVLWKVALRRLQVAEQQAARFVNYWPGERPQQATSVSRAEIEAALTDPKGAYQRLKRVMNAWNALWFWPLTETSVTPPSIDEWIDGLEGILGRPYSTVSKIAPKKFGHTEGQTSALSSASWGDLQTFEAFDYPLAGMRDARELSAEHPWLAVCDRIAGDEMPATEIDAKRGQQRAFFHWELEFASVFGRGGFDLQVGNPPWVRPRSDEAALLAEHDAWWQLAEKPTQALVRQKREQTLALPGARDAFVDGAVPTSVLATFLGASSQYGLLTGLQPDLYRTFMMRTWRNTSSSGAISLIHPGSHFTEKKAHHLRAETYRRLRRHWAFRNKKKLFAELTDQLEYAIHVYGAEQESPKFVMAASLYVPATVESSFLHDGSGEAPALKTASGAWDTRGHSERLVHVDFDVLKVWADILDEPGTPPLHARMVYPVNRASMNVLEKLSKAPRVRELGLQYSSGWHETADRKKGYFEVGSKINDSWDDVILQGPHFSVANPFSKQPRKVVRSNNDWDEIDLEALSEDFIPRTSYQPVRDGNVDYDHDYTKWDVGGELTSAHEHLRLGWRRMAGTSGVRSLNVTLLPVGATHVNTVASGGLPTSGGDQKLMELFGVFSTIPLDFVVKTAGIGDFYPSVIEMLPFASEHHLQPEVAKRAARLLCLTSAYSDIYELVVHEKWALDTALKVAVERRRVQIELDALVAITFGIDIDELCTIYRTQFPVLRGYEQNDLYDANGRKVPGEMNKLYRQRGEGLSVEERTWVHPQSNAKYVFEFPFQGFDREEDMRAAYAHFEKMLVQEPAVELIK